LHVKKTQHSFNNENYFTLT